jgi:hypothetical protein
MYQIKGRPIELRAIDLVLDPFGYEDVLGMQIRAAQLEDETVNQLTAALPQAIAQLDAIGDLHGSLALAGLYDQLARLEPAV